jgi:putative peptidoglycan lipid II flippase
VRIAIVVLVCTQLLNIVFVPWLGHAGLALSIGIGALVNAGWLYRGLRQRGLYQPSPGWGPFAARVIAASAVVGGWLLWVSAQVDWIAMQVHWGWRAGLLAAALTGALLLYFGSLRLIGLNLRQFTRRV